MKKIFYYACVLLVFSATAISCKKDSTTNGNGVIPSNCVNNLPWVQAGRTWVYSNEPIYIYADSLVITIDNEVSSGIFKTTTKYDDGAIFPTVTQYVKACDKDAYYATASDMSNAYLAYKLSGNVNDTWNYASNTVQGYSATATNKIVAKNVSVSVPAGTFSCTQIHTDIASSAPGALPVYTETYVSEQYGLIKVDGNTAHYELVHKNF
jgi:hypothetical protein